MLDTARKSASRVKRENRAAYDADENLRLALAHLIQVLGEAARRVSPEFRQMHPEVPWNEIIGMRHKIVHDYLRVDEDIIWQVATVDLPRLVQTLDRLVPPETSP
jgi:uncharacterized protein with HEPN domain